MCMLPACAKIACIGPGFSTLQLWHLCVHMLTLQSSKEQVMELNVELESLKMDARNSHSVAGNSLFGEVSH